MWQGDRGRQGGGRTWAEIRTLTLRIAQRSYASPTGRVYRTDGEFLSHRPSPDAPPRPATVRVEPTPPPRVRFAEVHLQQFLRLKG